MRTTRRPTSSGEIWQLSRSRNASFSANDVVQSLKAATELRLVFQTNACGGIIKMPEDSLTKQILLPISYLEDDLKDRAFESIKFGAIQMGRTVSYYKKDEKYFTEISPVIK